MWVATGKNLQMTEGDYGVSLPYKLRGITFVVADSVKITIKTDLDGATLVTKDYTNIQNNTVPISFTAAESAKLKPGDWVYILDWYRDGTFMYNIANGASFKVVNKG